MSEVVDMPRRFVLVDLRSVVGNCALFWAEGRSGYTCDLDAAHVFDEAEAWSQHRCRPEEDMPIPLDVARALVVSHVRRSALTSWRRDNPDPRQCATCPYCRSLKRPIAGTPSYHCACKGNEGEATDA